MKQPENNRQPIINAWGVLQDWIAEYERGRCSRADAYARWQEYAAVCERLGEGAFHFSNAASDDLRGIPNGYPETSPGDLKKSAAGLFMTDSVKQAKRQGGAPHIFRQQSRPQPSEMQAIIFSVTGTTGEMDGYVEVLLGGLYLSGILVSQTMNKAIDQETGLTTVFINTICRAAPMGHVSENDIPDMPSLTDDPFTPDF